MSQYSVTKTEEIDLSNLKDRDFLLLLSSLNAHYIMLEDLEVTRPAVLIDMLNENSEIINIALPPEFKTRTGLWMGGRLSPDLASNNGIIIKNAIKAQKLRVKAFIKKFMQDN